MQLQKNVFDEIAPLYDEALPLHVSRHYLKKRKGFILRYAKPDYRILDVGCGTGKLLGELLLEKNLEVHGCDSSKEMIKNAENPVKRKIICCESGYLPYKSEIFDIVVSIAVFHHLSSEGVLLETMREMIRVARKGAKVIIWDANPLNPYWLFLFKRMPHDRGVKRIVPLAKIILEARKFNLTNIEVFKSGWIPDFAPQKILSFFKFLEHVMERTLLINSFSAHNIIVFTK